MSVFVEAAGPGVTVQDRGRFGYARFGVPVSGPMDWYSFAACQALVGNVESEAAIEVAGGGLTVTAGADVVAAVTGVGFSVTAQGRARPLWMAFQLRKGWTLEIRPSGNGCWAYLAVAGALSIPPVLGSTSTYMRGKFGGLLGRSLQAGDFLSLDKTPREIASLAGREMAETARPAFGRSVAVDVVLGPQADYFEPESLDGFLSSPYQVSAASDRMGYRLNGNKLKHHSGADIISDGMTMGCIQVPASGQPIVAMADGPTTGGYPKIGVVATASLPLVAQCEPGRGEIRFGAIAVSEAQEKLRRMRNMLRSDILEPHITRMGW